MKNIRKKWFPAALLLLIGACGMCAQAAGLNVDAPAREDIVQMWNSLAIQEDLSTSYSDPPVNTAPYAAGRISPETAQNGLKTLNFIRYVAGIPYNVQFKEEYQEKAQAAALINCVQGGLSHSPARPSDMDQTLYDLCFSGASSSNLGMGYRNLYDEIVTGWMSDDDASNIDRVGHRRWCLNPAMQYTGFGIDGRYYAMYVFDESLGDRGYSKVAWPAQNMPLELFSGEMPWSLSIGSQIDAGSVSVTLKRINDGRTWNFSAGSSAGNFYINNENYGQKGCIIFRPLGIEGYRDGDQFEVTVTGTDLSVSYTVKFFWIHEHTGGTATCQRQAVCSKCGTPYGELGPHSFSTDWTIDVPAACTTEGSHSHHCTISGCSEISGSEPVPPLGHTGGRATCQERAVCTRCGTVYGELGPHSFSTDWTIDVPATCAAKGSRSHHCSVPGCSEKQDVEEIKKISHEWSKYQIVREPTALKEGEKVRTCSLCGKTQTTVVEANPPKTAAKAIKKVPSRITLKPGQIYRLKPRLLPSDSDYKLTYRSSNKKVAAVGLKGRIKAKRKGKAVITVRSGKIKVKCKVKVR